MKMKFYFILVVAMLLPMTIFGQGKDLFSGLENENYKRAIEILDQGGDKDEALSYLQKEVAEHPDNGFAYSMMAHVYKACNRVGEAMTCVNKAISLWKKNRILLATAYWQRASLNLKLGNEKAALRDWRKAIKADPTIDCVCADHAECPYKREKE